jgi:leader peptidase (prepilin peptidase) / N-methyltransferase
LVVGSFLNVVIHRVPLGLSVVRPGSRCPACGKSVRPRDNVPVLSWLLLSARCRDCSAPISRRYPLIELFTAVAFGTIAHRFGVTVVLPAYLYLAAVGIALAAIDLDVQRLPNALTLPSYAVGGALLTSAAAATGHWSMLLRGAIGMVALFALYFLLAFVYPAGMGFGDVKLAGLLGLYLGWLGWGAWCVGVFAGFLLGGIGGGIVIATHRGGRKTAIPFGPFMLAGALLAILAAGPIVSAYLSLLGV